MSLALPKHVYEARKAQKAEEARKAADDMASRLILDIPPLIDLPFKPDRWLMIVAQVKPKSTTGGIDIVDIVQENLAWTSGLGRVMAVGKAVYEGRQFADQGLGPDDAPKVGEFVIFNAKTPLRIPYEGRDYIFINDDATLARVTDNVDELKKLTRI
jgi:hypothetical protein